MGVRYLIPAGALLLGILALALRPATTREERIPRCRPGVEAASRPLPNPEPIQVPHEPPVTLRGAVETSVPEARRESRKADAGSATLERSRENMLYYLERELELAPEQILRITRVLQERQKEIEGFFKELRASRVFRTSEYERKVEAIREESYRRMGEMLGPAQYQRYTDLLAQGKLSDTVAFEMTPEMIVLD
jgi:hypothetical protein